MASFTPPEPALIFIPDISGFTRFVKDVEIEHSGHIVRELLEKVIDANSIGMEISEIEGDAVLFYRMGKAPTAKEVFDQVRKMYVEFHLHLKRYEQTRICHCGACVTAHKLRLKFIAHLGKLSTNKVKDHTKLFGTDVILAHRLLKNDISSDEYLLVTKSSAYLLDGWTHAARDNWKDIHIGSSEYDLGKVDYIWMPLEEIQNTVPEPTLQSYSIEPDAKELFRNEAILNAPINMVFDVMSDVSFRHKWQVGLQDSKDLNGRITHEGSTHRCVINDNSNDPFQVSHDFELGSDLVTWIDTDIVNGIHSVVRLERLSDQQTRVTMVTYSNFSVLKTIVVKLFLVSRLRSFNKKSLAKLDNYVKGLLKKHQSHSSRIILPSS